MLLDFNLPDSLTEYKADVCIVGSGAASLALLSVFQKINLNVLILEAGGEIISNESQSLYDVITPCYPIEGARDGRFRVFGGSTIRWGGQSLPYDKMDFRSRSWVANSGWPINYDELAAYYREVDKFLAVDTVPYEDDLSAMVKQLPAFADNPVVTKFSKWSSRPNLREHYRNHLEKSRNISLLKNANVFSIDLAENGTHVNTLRFRNAQWKSGSVDATTFILACGGIENPRLLLASNTQIESGVGNAHNNVGRFFQDHPNATVGHLIASQKTIQANYNYFFYKSTRILPRFMIRENTQSANQMLNSSAYFTFVADDNAPFSILKRLYRLHLQGDLSIKDLYNSLSVFRGIPDLFEVSRHYLVSKRIYTPRPVIRLDLMMEMNPEKDNRVTIGRETDALGLPKAIVSWKMNDQIYHTLQVCSEIYARTFAGAGLGSLKIADWILQKDYSEHLIDAKHHIGTTRMSVSPGNGVVDINCKVHDVDNLYIAGSSVFPTSGHSNPTATIIALAFRLADHIKTLAV